MECLDWRLLNVRFEVLTAKTNNTPLYRDVMPCTFLTIYHSTWIHVSEDRVFLFTLKVRIVQRKTKCPLVLMRRAVMLKSASNDVIIFPTAEFSVDLGSGLRCKKQTVPCVWPLTDILPSKIYSVEVQSCFVCVR